MEKKNSDVRVRPKNTGVGGGGESECRDIRETYQSQLDVMHILDAPNVAK
jgi:hypothetical protein